jgi:hypothetical protein
MTVILHPPVLKILEAQLLAKFTQMGFQYIWPAEFYGAGLNDLNTFGITAINSGRVWGDVIKLKISDVASSPDKQEIYINDTLIGAFDVNIAQLSGISGELAGVFASHAQQDGHTLDDYWLIRLGLLREIIAADYRGESEADATAFIRDFQTRAPVGILSISDDLAAPENENPFNARQSYVRAQCKFIAAYTSARADERRYMDQLGYDVFQQVINQVEFDETLAPVMYDVEGTEIRFHFQPIVYRGSRRYWTPEMMIRIFEFDVPIDSSSLSNT